MSDLVRWCVKARDGWHFAKPNKKFGEESTSVETACGSFVILPGGCDRRHTTCSECLDAVRKTGRK